MGWNYSLAWAVCRMVDGGTNPPVWQWGGGTVLVVLASAVWGNIRFIISAMKKKNIIIWLGLILVATVLLRLPNFNRPLGMGHEWVTAHALITLQAWWDKGMATFNYGPVINYTQPGDAGVPWFKYSLLEDARGNIYHASYPPLAYFVPYAVFKLLGIRPDVGTLEAFNLALSLFSGVIIFFTIYRLYMRKGSPFAATLGLWAAAAYLFVPSVLWFQTNTYFVDMLLQPLFILHIFLTLELLACEKPGRGLVAAWIGVYFLMAYTEWLAGPYLLVVMVMLWRRGDLKRLRWPFIGLCLAGAAAILLVVVHYASLAGLSRTMELLAGKFREKSGYSEDAKITPRNVAYMVRDFLLAFSGLWLLLAFQLTVLFAVIKGRWRQWLDRSETVLLTLGFWPLVLHFMVLMGFWVGHNYNTLKVAPLLAFLTAITMERVLANFQDDRCRRRVCLAMAAFCLVLSAGSYYQQTKPWRHDDSLRALGQEVARLSTPDEFICMKNPDRVVVPQIMFYAQRSILFYQDDAALAEHARRYHLPHGLLVEVDKEHKIISYKQLVFPLGDR